MYQVIDTQINVVVACYATRKAARRMADRNDAEYGAVRFIVKPMPGRFYCVIHRCEHVFHSLKTTAVLSNGQTAKISRK